MYSLRLRLPATLDTTFSVDTSLTDFFINGLKAPLNEVAKDFFLLLTRPSTDTKLALLKLSDELGDSEERDEVDEDE